MKAYPEQFTFFGRVVKWSSILMGEIITPVEVNAIAVLDQKRQITSWFAACF